VGDKRALGVFEELKNPKKQQKKGGLGLVKRWQVDRIGAADEQARTSRDP
jgi:hypothetical protein